MTTTAISGPSSVTGAPPLIQGPVPGVPNAPQPSTTNDNPDFAPSLFWMGVAVRDPRYLAHIGAGANVGGYPNQDCGWLIQAPLINQVPSTIATANIAVLANVTNGTPIPLVTATGAGITVQTAPFTVLPTGNVVPQAAVVIDGLPVWTGSGQSGAFSFMNPSNAYGRGISITGVGGGAGGAFKVVGFDIYGALTHETITVAAGVNTVNSAKTYKWILSVTPQFTDAHNYSVGTADNYGFPLYASQFENVSIFWDTAIVTSNTGFIAGVTTAGTATSTDPRGTYALQADASNGVKRLVISQQLDFAVVSSTVAGAVAGLIGVPQFAS